MSSTEDSSNAGDAETTSTRTRWRFLATAVALLLIGTLCAVIAAYVWRGEAVPLWATATFALLALAAGAWAFGAEALQAAAKVRGGGSG